MTDALSHTDNLSNVEASSDTEALNNVMSPRTNPFHEAVRQAQIRLAKVIADNSLEKRATAPPAMATESLCKGDVARAEKSPAAKPDRCPPPWEIDLPWLYMSKSDAIFLTASWLALAICLVPQLF